MQEKKVWNDQHLKGLEQFNLGIILKVHKERINSVQLAKWNYWTIPTIQYNALIAGISVILKTKQDFWNEVYNLQ